MTKLVYCSIFIALCCSTLEFQLPIPAKIKENKSIREVLTLVKAEGLAFLKDFLENFDITLDTNRPINWLQIVLKLMDLYQQNIAYIVLECLNNNTVSISSISEKIKLEPQKCFIEPLESLTRGANGTMLDFFEMFRNFTEFYKGLKEEDSTDVLFSALKLGVSEKYDLMDMNEQIVRLTNSTFELILIPACFFDQTTSILKNIQTEYNETMCCIRSGLKNNTCPDGEIEDMS